MKVVFLSNYFNHHQAALSESLYRQIGEGYRFIATGEMRAERRALGYGRWEIPGYVQTAHTGKSDLIACKRLLAQADVVIAGAAPERLIAPRIRAGKLTFRYTERLFKREPSRMEYLKKRIAQRWRNPQKKPVYLLSAGADTASDYARLGVFQHRAYRWGYFPETKFYEADELLCGKDSTSILWVGRFLDWKHPEQAIEVASRLKRAGYHFVMDMIGIGPMEHQMRQMIDKKGVGDCVRLLGAMEPEQVRSHMERAGIFLFTSDRQEGWGAVLNESMNSGCAVVASHAIGSVPYLIEDGENGLIYRSGDVDGLAEMVKSLLDDPCRQAELGRKAYGTITQLWNAEAAARRFVELSTLILAGENNPHLYESGPCSREQTLDKDIILEEK